MFPFGMVRNFDVDSHCLCNLSRYVLRAKRLRGSGDGAFGGMREYFARASILVLVGEGGAKGGGDRRDL